MGNFWDAIEVKAALALLRAVVYPEAASEALKRRIVKSSGDVKVPLTSGLGEHASAVFVVTQILEWPVDDLSVG